MEVQATEAKAKLSELLDLAEGGEIVVITRRGRVVARLMPPEPNEEEARAARMAALGRIRARRANMPKIEMTADEVKALAREGLS